MCVEKMARRKRPALPSGFKLNDASISAPLIRQLMIPKLGLCQIMKILPRICGEFHFSILPCFNSLSIVYRYDPRSLSEEVNPAGKLRVPLSIREDVAHFVWILGFKGDAATALVRNFCFSRWDLYRPSSSQ